MGASNNPTQSLSQGVIVLPCKVSRYPLGRGKRLYDNGMFWGRAMFSIYVMVIRKQMQKDRLSVAVKAICYSNIFDKIS